MATAGIASGWRFRNTLKEKRTFGYLPLDAKHYPQAGKWLIRQIFGGTAFPGCARSRTQDKSLCQQSEKLMGKDKHREEGNQKP